MNKKAELSFKVDNIFNSDGFSMERTKPLIEGIDYIMPPYTSGEEYTNVESSRNGRTYSVTLKYNFGELQKNQKRFRSTGPGDGGGSGGYQTGSPGQNYSGGGGGGGNGGGEGGGTQSPGGPGGNGCVIIRYKTSA